MKKIVSLLLALLIVFSMSVTAFAAGENETTTTNGTASSQVNLKLSNSQISVTVPTTIVATVGADGALTFPEAAATKITNNSIFPIKVTSIVATATSGWTMASEYTTGNDTIVAEVNSVDLLATSPTITGETWNMTANGGVINLAFSGKVHGLTKGLDVADAGTNAFAVAFTVEAGSYT